MSDNPMVRIHDFAGLSKPIEKLIDVVDRWAGKLYEPQHHTKMTKARLLDLQLVHEAIDNNPALAFRYQDENLWIESPAMVELSKRAANRLAFQEISKQQNIESVVQIAYENLSDVTDVSDEPVETDWIIRFMKSVEDISEKQMQVLWGKILAGEVSKPNSFSFRTLESVKNLSLKEAKVFENMCALTLLSDDSLFLPRNTELLQHHGITYPDLLLMEECGLLNLASLDYTMETKSDQPLYLVNGHLIWVIKRDPDTTLNLRFGVFPVTNCGKQLFNVIKVMPNLDFIVEFVNSIKTENQSLNLHHSVHRIQEYNQNGRIIYDTTDLSL